MSYSAGLVPNGNNVFAKTFTSTNPIGQPPFFVSSNTVVANLNAQYAQHSHSAGNVELSGVIYTTSNSAVTHLTDQTGVGNVVVVQNSPELITPNIGYAFAEHIQVAGQIESMYTR